MGWQTNLERWGCHATDENLMVGVAKGAPVPEKRLHGRRLVGHDDYQSWRGLDAQVLVKR